VITSPPLLVPIGQLGKTHGVKGEIRFRPYRPFFVDLLKHDQVNTVGTKHLTLIDFRQTASFMLLLFAGIDTPEKAQFHVNQEIWFPLSEVENITPSPINLPEQWIGWVVMANNTILGKVIDVLQTKANDILTIKNEQDEEWLVPVIPEYILAIDQKTQSLSIKKPILV